MESTNGLDVNPPMELVGGLTVEEGESDTKREGKKAMEYLAIKIDESEKEEEPSQNHRKEKLMSPPNEASSSSSGAKEKHKAIELPPTVNNNNEYAASEVVETIESQHQKDKADKLCLQRSRASIQKRLSNLRKNSLKARRQVPTDEGATSSICSFGFPRSLVGITEKAREPEIVSIGPYHHKGNPHLLEFEDHKLSFVDKFVRRHSISPLRSFLEKMVELEARTRKCYAGDIAMERHDFVEMMLVDGVFVIELLRHLGQSKEVIEEHDPIFARPDLIPIMLRDLLKLENQLPFFVLKWLFRNIRDQADEIKSLPNLALKVFDLVYPRSLETIKQRLADRKFKHLLDLFYQSLLPEVTNLHDPDYYRPSAHSIECVSHLRPSGIKFKSRSAESFLDIDYHSPVLEIPPITINDFTSTIIVNSVAFEQCVENNKPQYFTCYASFMNCLIKQPRDVAFLCSDGIITTHDDQNVADLFKKIGTNVAFNIRNCYLAKQFREVEAYHSSNWATMMRTYFSSPWSFISVFSAFLLIALTMVQTVISILTFTNSR